MIGRELIYDESLSTPERLYIALLGVPINGLRNRARRILPIINGAGKRILDAGCGQGVFTFEIARRFPDAVVTGIDVNVGLVERNRKIAGAVGISNCRFEVRDITADAGGAAYDIVLSADVLEHIDDDDAVLGFYRDSLAPGGELILHVPGRERRWFFFGWKENFDVDGHVRPGYTLEEITEKVTHAGLAVGESYDTYGWLETVTNNISYLITGARMRRKHLYALVFPLLLAVSWFGRNARPKRGAGVLVRAVKEA